MGSCPVLKEIIPAKDEEKNQSENENDQHMIDNETFHQEETRKVFASHNDFKSTVP